MIATRLCPQAAPALPPAFAPHATPPRRRVLVVDDEVGISLLISQCLKHAGIDTIVANSGAEALALLRDRPDDFDLALVDLQMPVADGPETIRDLRRLRHDLPVLLMSGCCSREALSRCEGQVLAGVIQKPFTLKQLVGVVTRALEEYRRIV